MTVLIADVQLDCPHNGNRGRLASRDCSSCHGSRVEVIVPVVATAPQQLLSGPFLSSLNITRRIIISDNIKYAQISALILSYINA